MIKIVHIINDEKFIDTAISIFDSLGESIRSYYFCYTNSELKYIRKKDRVITFNDEASIINLINQNNYDIVFLHSQILSFTSLSRINKNIILIWISWGYDLYNQAPYILPKIAPININVYKPLTRHYLRKHFSYRGLIRYIVKLNYFKDLSKKNRFYNRVDYLSTILPIEFDYITRFCKKHLIKQFHFAYMRNIPYEKIVNIDYSNGKNILLGNSGAETNNHIDVLKEISLLNIGNRKIIIPISYCGSVDYIKYLKIKVNEFNLENNVVFLENFLAFEDYEKLISSCGYAIFGHVRQQALGNINIMIRNGCKVFFYKDSFAYKQLIKDGLIVYTIESLNSESFVSLSKTEIKHNQLSYINKYNYNEYIQSLKKDIVSLKYSK